MKLDQLISEVFDIKNYPAFSELQKNILEYDFTQDPVIENDSYDNQNAFKDSYVLQIFSHGMINGGVSRYKKGSTKETNNLINKTKDLITYFLNKIYSDHTLFKAHIIGIKPNGKQKMHIDAHFFHKHTIRLNLPIITNNKCFTNMNGTIYYLTEGTFYTMDGTVLHGSENHSKVMRTHLFLDIVPPKHLPILTNFYRLQHKQNNNTAKNIDN